MTKYFAGEHILKVFNNSYIPDEGDVNIPTSSFTSSTNFSHSNLISNSNRFNFSDKFWFSISLQFSDSDKLKSPSQFPSSKTFSFSHNIFISDPNESDSNDFGFSSRFGFTFNHTITQLFHQTSYYSKLSINQTEFKKLLVIISLSFCAVILIVASGYLIYKKCSNPKKSKFLDSSDVLDFPDPVGIIVEH
jgi:hypothetical protein